MKKNCFLFFLFFIQLCLGQNPLTIFEKNHDINTTKKLEFFQDTDRSKNINTIKTTLFKPYKNTNYFPNLYKAKFWFRIHLRNGDTLPQDLLFKIRAYSYLKEVIIYQVNADGTKKLYHHTNYLNRKLETAFILEREATYYFEVDFLSTVMFKLQIVSPKNNQINLLKENTLQGLYYGFSLLVLSLNILFYFFTKKSFFIHYTIFQLGIIGSIAFLDNHIYMLTENSYLNCAFNIMCKYTISLGSILFISSTLNLKKRFPAFNYISYSLLFIAFALSIFNFLRATDNNSSITINLLILVFGYAMAIYYSKKLVYARFIVAGYTILFICHILYISPVLMGYKDFGFYEWHYKVGSVLEMFIFMIAIPYNHKILFTEKQALDTIFSAKEATFKREIAILKDSKINIEEQLSKFSDDYALKKRESEILRIMNTGATNKEIAEKLIISVDTVKQHCSRLYSKTGVKNRTTLIALLNERDFSKSESNHFSGHNKRRKDV